MDITDITPRADTSERLCTQRLDMDRPDMRRLDMDRRPDMDRLDMQRLDMDRLDMRRLDMDRLDMRRLDMDRRPDMDRLDMQRLDMLDRRDMRRRQELKNRLPHRDTLRQRTPEVRTCQHAADIRANIRSSNELTRPPMTDHGGGKRRVLVIGGAEQTLRGTNRSAAVIA
jgi:hypothetical protein